MNENQARELVVESAKAIGEHGMAAPAPTATDFMMMTILVLNDLLTRIENIEYYLEKNARDRTD